MYVYKLDIITDYYCNNNLLYLRFLEEVVYCFWTN